MTENTHAVYCSPMKAVALALLSALSTQVFAATVPFSDTRYSFFAEAINDLRAEGIIHGYPDGSFQPKNAVNRAEFLKLLLGGDITSPGSDCFPDVPAEAWYAPYACAARRDGIAQGYPDGTLRPEEPVNYAEALAFVYRAYDLDTEGSGSGENWYLPYERAANTEGVLLTHTYIPWRELTRERAAELIYSARQLRDEGRRERGWETSPGCGRSAPVTPPSSLQVSGEQRNFITSVPSNYTARTPHGLIIAFHGRTNSNAQVQRYFGLEKDHDGFIVVYPAAIDNGNGTFSWSNPGDSAKSLRDLQFFDAIVSTFQNEYCIDRDEIFVVGHSLGAWFANVVSCVRGSVVRGSATVAGNTSYTECLHPTATAFFHNPADPAVSYDSGLVALQQKIEQNNCSQEAVPQVIRGHQCEMYTGCRDGNPVYWCPYSDTVGGGDHSWPSGGGQTILTFFRDITSGVL